MARLKSAIKSLGDSPRVNPEVSRVWTMFL
jgi:hypothetical protein